MPNPKPFTGPTIADIKKVIRSEIESYYSAYRNRDGIIEDQRIKHTIACLEKAVVLLPRR